jgi:ribonuclease BN (tRNA processing enzyme)
MALLAVAFDIQKQLFFDQGNGDIVSMHRKKNNGNIAYIFVNHVQ